VTLSFIDALIAVTYLTFYQFAIEVIALYLPFASYWRWTISWLKI